MPAESYILAIDQGTTGTTAMVFDQHAQVCGRAMREFPQYYPQTGWVEHDAEEIWQTTLATVGSALQAAGIEAVKLQAIGIANQRETVVLWDRRTGSPVGRAVVWQDRRTAQLCRELGAEGLEPVWQQKTGLLLDPYFSGTKIAWLLEHQPGLRSRAVAGDIAFGTIDSWLIWKLSGGRLHITDVTNASRTQLYNIHEGCWDAGILSRLDIPDCMLASVKPSAAIYGETAPDAFFGASVALAGIAGDQQAALFGQACYQPGDAKNTYGTGSFILLNTGKSAAVSRERLLTTIAWKIGDEPVEYALEGSVFVAGAAVQWLRDGLGLIQNADETEALARSVPDNGGVFFVPALTGLGAPYWNPDARGLICGLTRGTTRAHLVRATLESIAFQSADVIAAMCRDADIQLSELRADGGASVNAFLMQLQADLLNVPVEIPVVHETTAFGVACLAGLASGVWPNRAALRRQRAIARRYEPEMTCTERHKSLSAWWQAVSLANRR